jgi:DNA-binding NtrC family response regulator
MPRLPRILICDDDSTFHLAVKYALKGKCECRSAYHSDEALAILKSHSIDILLLDIQIRTPNEGLDKLKILRATDPEMAIVMSSGRTDFSTVREAMRLGATDYLPKDFDPEELKHIISRMMERKGLLSRNAQQDYEAVAQQRRHVLIGESPAIRSLRKVIEKVRESDANVIVTGETGCGKEVVARQLRRALADGSLAPFVAVDSATIQGSTAESTLFGHEKGAFTGAERATKGLFEEADGGIVYVDEIGNMSLEIQAKLLRVLQEKEVVRLGSTRPIPLEFRVVCATNRDLEEMVSKGEFKDDLLQRLSVLPIGIPPLRERREDIPLLVQHFASLHAKSRPNLTFTEEAIEALRDYRWTGNVRELGNVIAYVTAMAEGDEVDVSDLPPKIRDSSAKATSSGAGFYERVAGYEHDVLAKEYSAHGGNISRMAIQLGMDRSHLYTKLREHGIHPRKG